MLREVEPTEEKGAEFVGDFKSGYQAHFLQMILATCVHREKFRVFLVCQVDYNKDYLHRWVSSYLFY